MANCIPSLAKIVDKPSGSALLTQHSRFNNSALESFLYGKNVVLAIDMEKIRQKKSLDNPVNESKNHEKSGKSQACELCLGKKDGQCAAHGPLQSLRQLVHEKDEGKSQEDIQPTYAVMSFPDEVQLCTSSIPGVNYGVCAKQHLPSGTWIGPYEGRRIVGQQLIHTEHNEHCWEIYEEGQFSHFIDGSDENSSSWMRFIRCARDEKEQNMAAFQYGQNIYYRSFRDISAGEELLVWYSDSYLKHFGIPLNLKDAEQAKIEEPTENLNGRRLASNLPNTSVSSPYSKNLITSESPFYRSTDHIPKNPDQIYGTNVGKSTLRYSFPYFEPVSSTVQQTLAHQIKIRRERTQFFPDEPTATNSEELPGCPPREQLTLNFNDKNYLERYLDRRNIETEVQGGNGLKASTLDDLSSPFKCRQCLKVFTQRVQLQMHVCPKCPYKPFQCGHCSLSFAHPLELRNHVVVHTSERPFKCGFCGRSFAGATTLNNHVRTHTGEKPFVCNNCGKTFSIATQLSRHARVPGECPGFVANESSKNLGVTEKKQG